MEGWWKRGQGEVPDALFDAQFACNEEDSRFCKGLGKSGDSYQHSKHAADYRVANKVAKAKGTAKGEEQPAAGGRCSKFVQDRGLPFTSNILKWDKYGTWQYREGKCVSLPHLFAKCGHLFTAAQLCAYYNLCRPIASKRPHAWSSPARQVAANERKAATGRYGHGS